MPRTIALQKQQHFLLLPFSRTYSNRISPIIMATPFFGGFKHISSLTIISSPLCSHNHFHQQSKRENPLRSHAKTDFPPSIQSNGSFLFFQLIARESSRLLQPGRRLLAREGERRENAGRKGRCFGRNRQANPMFHLRNAIIKQRKNCKIMHGNLTNPNFIWR